MKDIIVKLLAIYHYAKDIHYTAQGESFYAIHTLMDRICDGIHDQVDDINEVCYLGTNKEAPFSYDILKIVTASIPEKGPTSYMLGFLDEMLENAIAAISELKEKTYMSGGEASLLDDIQKTLLQKRGLVLRSKNI